ncbi:formate C-acetyltransferase [Syntrophomonas wolfei]|uniref:Formate acetyltransferase n=1 Tax=Syntrophomonas wolfei subsp. wolfei (strain DSM 2245B / Goettingen) TaxID=335541 RepID=Q0AY44_SYNWW|nr:Formate C-acetyltransferase [Syntrophomonas wolfei subsp. wolfei str. Goettingen G311]
MQAAWSGFKAGRWMHEIDVRDFIQKNYSPYDGDSGFLTGPGEKTSLLWRKCQDLLQKERESKGVLLVDADTPLSITSHPPGYIDRELEKIIGLQTDKALKRAINVYGGLKMTLNACRAYGYEPDKKLLKFFEKHRRTHNDGVFAVYTPEMRLARKVGIITGLPDSYGRGRIIGDCRRVSLYGVDFLIKAKENDRDWLNRRMTPELIQLREDMAGQIKSLQDLKQMAKSYDYDISRPAATAVEAVQHLYFAYLAAVKEQNGAAMSLGRVSTFLDIYLERDLRLGRITENEAQELIDQLVIKLRLVRHLRTPEYSEIFAGDPNWVTESLGGSGTDGRHLVSKTSYRFLQTLKNLGAAPEPNMTILWSRNLPRNFLEFCAKLSISTSALQYENDDLMRDYYGDDYGIACCVSAMRLGKETQLFGARCNLAKLLLYAINGGKDEISGQQVGVEMSVYDGDRLEFGEVMRRFKIQMEWLAELYVNTMNLIHYMHDKYAYEYVQMALHNTFVKHFMAFGIAGLSVAADSLSAIKYAKVRPIKDERGLVSDFAIEGEFPKFGNDDDRVDLLAVEIIHTFIHQLKRHPAYRDAQHTLSILTITSNVMYGKYTGTTPDGRQKGEPLAPGANPLHGREEKGAIAACNSVAKLPYEDARDGISFTFSTVPEALGKSKEERVNNLLALLEGYFVQDAHHMNVNVLNVETLKEAMEHPEKYPDLTIRVSGYAVHFTKLNREQQEEIIMRTFYRRM